MQVDIFDFDLDKSLIAKEPVSPRDTSKLLDLSDEDVIRDKHFYDLPEILHQGYTGSPLCQKRKCFG